MLENRTNIGLADSKEGAGKKGSPWSWLHRLAEDLGSMADPFGFDKYAFELTGAFLRGYDDALHDVWSAVEEGGDPSRQESKVTSPDVQRSVGNSGVEIL